MADGGAFDPKVATTALIDAIKYKASKPNYQTLKADLGLAEHVLVVHYGIRGLLHNTPFEGINWKLDDILEKVRAEFQHFHGPFDRGYLYLTYNEGPLYQL